jgi:hypothetical protein
MVRRRYCAVPNHEASSFETRQRSISDARGYINIEMVVQDRGAHLRSSGAEDLLAWTDAQWEAQAKARSKGRAWCESLPNQALASYPSVW